MVCNYEVMLLYYCSVGYDPSVCHHIMISDLMCQGYLVKEGGRVVKKGI